MLSWNYLCRPHSRRRLNSLRTCAHKTWQPPGRRLGGYMGKQRAAQLHTQQRQTEGSVWQMRLQLYLRRMPVHSLCSQWRLARGRSNLSIRAEYSTVVTSRSLKVQYKYEGTNEAAMGSHCSIPGTIKPYRDMKVDGMLRMSVQGLRAVIANDDIELSCLRSNPQSLQILRRVKRNAWKRHCQNGNRHLRQPDRNDACQRQLPCAIP